MFGFSFKNKEGKVKRFKNSIKLFIVWFGNYHKLIFTEVLQNFIMSNYFFLVVNQ